MRRETPGPLSSIDMVPDDGRNDVQWAMDELNKRQRSQADILFELNDRLAVHGIGPISRSSFNRRAIMIYMQRKTLEDGTALVKALHGEITPETMSMGDKVLVEFIKTAANQLIAVSGGNFDTKQLLELARAFKVVLEAQGLSAELKKEAQKEFDEKASAAIDKVTKARGLSAETAKDIRAQILGVKE